MGLFGSPNIQKMIEKRDIQGLIKALKSQDVEVRKQAAEGLGSLRDPRAVEALTYAFNDKDEYVRMYAASALGKIKDPRATPVLLNAMARIKDHYEWKVFVHALAEISPHSALQPCISTLQQSPDYNRRCHAADVLAKIDDPQAKAALFDALQDREWVVQLSAMEGLCNDWGDRPLDPFLQAYHDVLNKALKAWGEQGMSNIRRSAQTAAGMLLAKTGRSEALAPLLQENDPFLRNTAARILGERNWKPVTNLEAIGVCIAAGDYTKAAGYGDEAVPALVEAGKVDSTDTQIKVIHALGKTGSQAAIDPLLKYMTGDQSYVASAAAAALNELGQPAIQVAVERCQAGLRSDSPLARKNAVKMLSGLPAEQARPLLSQVLQGKNDDLFPEALDAVERIGGPEQADLIIPHLQRTLTLKVRCKALVTLKKVKGERALDPQFMAGAIRPFLENLGAQVKPETRLSAIDCLRQIGDPHCVPALLPLLEDPSFEVRWLAAQALGNIGDRSALSYLIKAYNVEVKNILNAQAAGDGLSGKVTSYAAGSFSMDRFNTPYFQARPVLIALIQALGMLGDPCAVEPLGVVIGPKFSDPGIWSEAVKAFGEIGDPGGLRYLALVLKNPDSTYRGLAVEATGKIHCKEAQKLLQDRLKSEDDLDVRRKIEKALESFPNN